MIGRANPLLSAITIAVVAGLGLGCGTGGSGDSNALVVEGHVIDTANQPVADARITFYETAESSTTDENGAFVIEPYKRTAAAGFFLELPEFTNTAFVSAIPDFASRLEVTLLLDRSSRQLEILEAVFHDGNSPRPEPAPEVPDPSETPGARPTAGATPTARPGNFDSNGNTTKFGIPGGVTGNVGRGRSTWGSICASCHAREKSNRSYQDVKRSLATTPQMQGLGVSNQQVADVVAYLNRGRR